MDDPNESDDRKIKAQESVNSGNFLWIGILDHTYSCIGYAQYGAGRIALWATTKVPGKRPPQGVDISPLARRRRYGRPRRVHPTSLAPMS